MLDLEDAVAVGDKDAARVAVGDFLSTGVQVLVPVFVLFVACQRRITEGIVMTGMGGI